MAFDAVVLAEQLNALRAILWLETPPRCFNGGADVTDQNVAMLLRPRALGRATGRLIAGDDLITSRQQMTASFQCIADKRWREQCAAELACQQRFVAFLPAAYLDEIVVRGDEAFGAKKFLQNEDEATGARIDRERFAS